MDIKKEIIIKNKHEFYNEIPYFQKRIVELLHEQDYRTETTLNQIDFQKLPKTLSPSDKSHTAAYNVLRSGSFQILKMDSKTVKILYKINLNYLIFMCLISGFFIVLLGFLLFELGFLNSLITGLAVLFIIFTIGFFSIKIDMNDYIVRGFNI